MTEGKKKKSSSEKKLGLRVSPCGGKGRKIITATKTTQTRLLPRMFDEMLKAYSEVPKIGATA